MSKLEKINSSPAEGGGGPEKEKPKEDIEDVLKNIKESKEVNLEEFEKQIETVTDILQNEPEDIRPLNSKGEKGGLLKAKDNIPILIIPSLQRRVDILLKILEEKDENGESNLEKLKKGKIQIVCLGNIDADTIPSTDWEITIDQAKEEIKKKSFELYTSLQENEPRIDIRQTEYNEGYKKIEEEEVINNKLSELKTQWEQRAKTILTVLKLKEYFPNNFHILLGLSDEKNFFGEELRKFIVDNKLENPDEINLNDNKIREQIKKFFLDEIRGKQILGQYHDFENLTFLYFAGPKIYQKYKQLTFKLPQVVTGERYIASPGITLSLSPLQSSMEVLAKEAGYNTNNKFNLLGTKIKVGKQYPEDFFRRMDYTYIYLRVSHKIDIISPTSPDFKKRQYKKETLKLKENEEIEYLIIPELKEKINQHNISMEQPPQKINNTPETVKPEEIPPRELSQEIEKKQKESLEEILKDFDKLTKIEKLERKDIEPYLDKAIEILKNEPETIRPKDKNGEPGGLIELKKDIPTILIPDLHGRRDFLFKILNYKDKDNKTILEKVLNKEVQIIALGDVVHTENEEGMNRQKEAQFEYLNHQKFISDKMDKEIADSIGTVMMLIKLKELAPEYVHYIRGDHETQSGKVLDVEKDGVRQSELFRKYFIEKYGSDFLKKYDEFENSLPFMAKSKSFLATHFVPSSIIENQISLKELIQKVKENPKDLAVQKIMMNEFTHNDHIDNSRQLKEVGIKIYFYAHTGRVTAVDNWPLYTRPLTIKNSPQVPAARRYIGITPFYLKPYSYIPIHIKEANFIFYVEPNGNFKILDLKYPLDTNNINQLKQNDPKELNLITEEIKYRKALFEKLLGNPNLALEEKSKLEKIINDLNYIYQLINKGAQGELAYSTQEEKLNKETQTPTDKQSTQIKTPKQSSNTEKPVKEKQEWLKHLYEELQKIKDLEKNTEFERWKTYLEAKKLLIDWLPFGNLDQFKGIEELLELMEENRPKTLITFNYVKEKLSQRIAQEMALQFEKTEGTDKKKIDRIVNFVNKWLKDKSFYYQLGERFKQFWVTPNEKYPEWEGRSKLRIWFGREFSNVFKLIGQRDRTLKKISEILALEDISYKNIKNITRDIEHQLIKNSTLARVRNIEEMTKKEKNENLEKIRQEIQTTPVLPLKIEQYEKIYGEKVKKEKEEKKKEEKKEEKKETIKISDEELEMIIAAAGEMEEALKDPEVKKKAEELINKIKEIKDKKKITATPEQVQQAKDFVKKNKDKKEGWWATIGGLAGYGFLLALILFILGELKLGEKITDMGGNLSFGGKK